MESPLILFFVACLNPEFRNRWLAVDLVAVVGAAAAVVAVGAAVVAVEEELLVEPWFQPGG